jgi:hypothetical protein
MSLCVGRSFGIGLVRIFVLALKANVAALAPFHHQPLASRRARLSERAIEVISV